jgi:type VI secretion system protein ImpC
MSKTSKSQVGIRISSEPATTGKLRPAELPLHVLYMGDLVANQTSSKGSPAGEFPLRVDKNSFAPVMKSLSPSLKIEVPDRLSGTLKSLEVELEFPDLKAFRPEGVVAQVPALQRMLQTRTLIRQVRVGSLTLHDFGAKAREAGVDQDLADRFAAALKRPAGPPIPESRSGSRPNSPGKTDGAGKLEALLGMVDIEGTSEPVPVGPTPMDALITAVTADATGPGDVDAGTAEALVADLDQIIGEQVSSILHNQEFQRLEASWRAVKMLADRIDFRKNIILSILPCARNSAPEVLDETVTGPTLKKTHRLLSEAPVSAVVLDFLFGCSTSEIDLLAALAAQAAKIGAVCLTGAGADFLGKNSAAGFESLPPIWQLIQQPEYARWNSLRKTEEFKSIALALPRFLLRHPYGKDNPVKDFAFTEFAEGESAAGLALWGGGAVLVAIGLAGLFAEAGWQLQFRGFHAGPQIERLPLWDHGSSEGLHPLEVLVPSDKQEELSEAGFIVLSSRANFDGAFVASAPTFWPK